MKKIIIGLLFFSTAIVAMQQESGKEVFEGLDRKYTQEEEIILFFPYFVQKKVKDDGSDDYLDALTKSKLKAMACTVKRSIAVEYFKGADGFMSVEVEMMLVDCFFKNQSAVCESRTVRIDQCELPPGTKDRYTRMLNKLFKKCFTPTEYIDYCANQKEEK